MLVKIRTDGRMSRMTNYICWKDILTETRGKVEKCIIHLLERMSPTIRKSFLGIFMEISSGGELCQHLIGLEYPVRTERMLAQS